MAKKNQWQILANGDLYCKSWDYNIESSRLSEPDWLCHMRDKSDIDMLDFIEQYFKTLLKQNITSLTIRIYS